MEEKIFQTKITRMFGIQYPIIMGTMMRLARAEMVAAASNAGALGVLASATFPSRQTFRDELKKLKNMTDKPFAVNLNLFPTKRPVDNMEYLEDIVAEGVRIIETSGHKVSDQIASESKKNGMLLIHKCVGVRYALKAQSIGADAVTVVGYENGGATGVLDVTTLCLVPRVVDALNVPVIGGGGVTDGRGFLALLSLGAEAVIIGSMFLLSEECPIHPRLKEALIDATELDTMVIMRSIRNSHRVWRNRPAEKIAELEKSGAGLEELVAVASGERAKEMCENGDVNTGIISCGQGIGLVKKVMPMKDIVEAIIHQADALRKKLNNI